MSEASCTSATSRTKTAGKVPTRIGTPSRSLMFLTTELSGTIGYLSPSMTLPDGLIVLAAAMALTTASGDSFGHSLRHVRAGIELQLDSRRALNGFRFDVFDAGDVEEVVFVVISEITLHLRRVHATVRLRDVDRRNAERREDVPRHALEGESRAEHDRDDEHHDHQGPAHGGLDEVH